MKTNTIALFAVALLGVATFSGAQVTNSTSPWLPMLSAPLSPERLQGSITHINRVTGNTEAPATVWVDRMDVNGDKKEDAVVTITKHGGAGARGHLWQHRTFVFLGSAPPNAVFKWSGATLWFSLETNYAMHQTKFPDVVIRRQFTIGQSENKWTVRIHETRLSNLAGDSSTRGMMLDSSVDSSVPVAEMKDWKPRILR